CARSAISTSWSTNWPGARRWTRSCAPRNGATTARASGATPLIPWETLDTATIPGGAESLRLKRRGTEFSIMLGANELMNSRLSGSEEALARLTIERLRQPSPRVLIGGLGLGFTLRACLPLLPPSAQITV